MIIDDGMSVSSLLCHFDLYEIWRPVVGWTKYEVSSWGSIRRVGARASLRPGCTGGYANVTLSESPRIKTVRIHIAVTEAFIGPPPFLGAIVAHNDGDPLNCRVGNIRWASVRENQIDRRRHDRHLHGSKVFGAKLTEAQIPVIRARIATGERYENIAADFGVSKFTISLIKLGKIWRRAGGAAWSVAA